MRCIKKNIRGKKGHREKKYNSHENIIIIHESNSQTKVYLICPLSIPQRT